jgi:hypothetical protein
LENIAQFLFAGRIERPAKIAATAKKSLGKARKNRC